jgi:AraC-like DNA-binding protein
METESVSINAQVGGVVVVSPAPAVPAPALGKVKRAIPGLGRAAKPLLRQASANSDGTDNVIEALIRSQICQDFRQAFSEAVGLPLALQPAGSWRLPHHGSRMENPFCALVASRSRTCVACLQSHERLWESALEGPATMTCSYGLWETAVPVRLGNDVIGFLHTGQAFQWQPTEPEFRRVRRLIARAAPEVDPQEIEVAWQNTPVVPERKWQALASMLNTFAQHLSLLSDQMAVQNRHAEAPVITRVKEFIEANYSEHLSLTTAARVAHASSFYFCKLFKRVTGLNFTDYVARVRIEKAKNLLLNPNLRISEIAFEVGFQSLTHFNRVFKRMVGQSPSQYRSQLPMA